MSREGRFSIRGLSSGPVGEIRVDADGFALLFLGPLLSPALAAGDNLLQNGDFERKGGQAVDGWMTIWPRQIQDPAPASDPAGTGSTRVPGPDPTRDRPGIDPR